MTRVSADFHFGVRGLWVQAELLGTSATIIRDGYTVVLRIPSSDDDFSYGAANPPRVLAGGAQDPEGHWLRCSVVLLRATLQLDIPMATGPADDVPREAIDASRIELGRAADTARRVVGDYVELVRTRHDQYWLGQSGDRPRVTWITELRDVATGERVPTGYQDPLGSVIVLADGIGRTEHDAVVRALKEQVSPRLPESLLADAKYLGWTAEPGQPREALVLAAIASEVGIRDALRAVCPPEASPLLEFALANPRDVSVQAASLFDKAALAAAGRSLRKEDRKLYKALVKLFEDRNGAVHRGATPSSDIVRADLLAADGALRWAASLTA
jgi:hypothetical protein